MPPELAEPGSGHHLRPPPEPGSGIVELRPRPMSLQ